MARKRVLFVDWHSVEGSAQAKRKLTLDSNDKGKYTCPVKLCLHTDFKTKRGLRKHIDSKHPWYYYFDEQPEVKREQMEENQATLPKRASTTSKPYYSMDEGIGNEFLQWLCTTCGGGKSQREAKQIAKRALKFLMECTGGNESDVSLSYELIDCCLGSAAIIIRFLKTLEEEWKLSCSASVSYVKSLTDLLDFRKANGVTDSNLRCFTVTEVYLRRAKENLRKKKNLECTRNYDLETLIARDSWATLEEMELVIPYHIGKFKSIIEKCKRQSPLPNKQELSFCTRFMTTFLFLRVKCSRPMTFQYLTLPMIDKARVNEGFIDQTEFKTASKYSFDTLIINTSVFTILDLYIDYVRPLLSPKCDYLLISCSGNQYQSLTTAMTMLVHEAIGKYIHPTRYRQIVETASAELLSREEQELISEDQKHSSQVAKVYYKKKQSRNVAIGGMKCMEKMIGLSRRYQDDNISDILTELKDLNSGWRAENTNNQNDSLTGESNSPFLPSTEEADNLSNRSVYTSYTHLEPSASSGDLIDQVQTLLSVNQSVADKNDDREDSDIEMTVTMSVPPTIDILDESSYDISKITSSVSIKKEEVNKEVKKALKNIKFTNEEDSFLKHGIEKYGCKNWSSILKDEQYKFHKSRTRDSLRVRADSLTFKRFCKKNQ